MSGSSMDDAFRVNSSSETFGFSLDVDSPANLSPMPRDLNENLESSATESTSHERGRRATRSMRNMSFRDDPFKGLMDDPEDIQERVRLRKQKYLWNIVEEHATNLAKDESAHSAACSSLVELFRTNPE